MKKLILFLLICVQFTTQAQQSYNIDIPKIDEAIILDGSLDEDIWKSVSVYAKNYQQYFPTDSVIAEDNTTIRMAFDDEYLYVAIECFSRGSNYTIPTLRRDYRAGGNDNITLLIDPFSDGANAFMFGTNPAGVQREGLISQGGTNNQGFSTSWDNKWKCETKIYDNKYVSEMAIPFSTLRFNKGVKQWKFGSYRFDMQANERSTWIPIPRNQVIFNLGFMGNMNFQEEITASGSKVSLIPYTISSYEEDLEAGTPSDLKFNIGGDAKIAITSGLNLDITANPDFSQVEVDQQVTNLSRFEISFPERRQFFLENADLFSSFGFENINPFFSRRIGIVNDTTTDTNIQNAIYGGVRLSGKINNNWRIGLLSMMTQREEKAGQPDINYTVATVQRKLGARSNIGAILVNRQSINASDSDITERYNRIIGLDYNLATQSNLWSGKTFVHKSISVDKKDDAIAHGFDLTYNKRKFLARWQHEYVGDGYDAQVGFIRRTDYFRVGPDFRYFFYPSSGIVNRSNLFINYRQFWIPGLGKTDQDIATGVSFDFSNNARLSFELGRKYIFLFDEFDPTGTESSPLPQDTDYSYYFLMANYSSDNSKLLSTRFRPYVGQYFNGKRYGARGSVTYRVEPYGSVALNYNYNLFDMPYLNETKSTILLGPRFDVSFTKSIFLTAFFQYNSQSQNTNINTRFQWRFAPASDFFLVYSDNYFSGNPDDPSDRFDFNLRNRSIVAKVTYWLNM